MAFISKLIAMFGKLRAPKEIKPPIEPVKTKHEELKLDLDEEMLDSGVSFEPQNGEGGLEGLFNVNEEDKQNEKKDEGGEEGEKKEDSSSAEASDDEEQKEE
ncbi:MAG: hypothetical protein V1661_00960 [bacterium]